MVSSPVRERISPRRLRHLLSDLDSGRGEALSSLIALYGPYLMATARARLEDRLRAKAGPSDLVQETMAEAHRAWNRLDTRPKTEDEFREWLRGILLERLKALRRRYYRAKNRSLRRERSLDGDESKRLIDQLAVGASETPSGRFDRKELVERLEEALLRLAPAYRQVILWRNRDGLRFVEIGARMDRSADAARMLWCRAIRQLKRELGVEDGDR